jgi:inosose dehydratase
MEVEGWTGQQPYREVLDEMQNAGYAGTELGPYGYFPAEPDRLTRELAARKLQLVAAFVPIPLAEPELHENAFLETLRVAKLLATAGARMIVLADAMSPSRMAIAGRVTGNGDGLSDAQWRGAAQILSRTAEACRELGLDAVFHHHAGTYIETPREIERLCASVDERLLGLCLDTGHYFYGGGDPRAALHAYGARIRHLHLKDVRPQVLESVRREDWDFLEAVRRGVFCELGDGAIPFPEIVTALSTAGFSGWAIVEQDTDVRQADVNPLQSAIRSRQYLHETIGI